MSMCPSPPRGLLFDKITSYQARITNQLRRLGGSYDWDRVAFTMNPVCIAFDEIAFVLITCFSRFLRLLSRRFADSMKGAFCTAPTAS